MMRSGKNLSFVEASICLPEFKDNVIVSREIGSSGKNVCKIDGRLVTVNELRDFMKKVIDIHGQNDTQTIFDLSTHIDLLDGYARKDIESLKADYQKLYKKYLSLKKEWNLNYGDDLEKQRKLDLLNYQLKEIEEADLKENEEEELEEKRKRIMASEKIAKNLKEAQCEIDNNLIDGLNCTIRALENIEQYDEMYRDSMSRLKSCYYEMQEVARDLSSEEVSFDEEEQNQVEERLDLINSLKRKYGSDIQQILEYREKVENEIFTIQNLESYILELKDRLDECEKDMMEVCQEMNKIRAEYAVKLSHEITKELADLEMKKAKFEIKVTWIEDNNFNINGLNQVEFLISTNQGEPHKSLIKIASGGEISRVMLAIKTVLADVDKTPVLVFDEIDTGISGVAANRIGEKMKKIAQNQQVICITHLASIAAKGDYNYFVSKEVKNEKTKTKIKLLDEQEVLEEIARISSGTITDISINHAKELRKMSLKETA